MSDSEGITGTRSHAPETGSKVWKQIRKDYRDLLHERRAEIVTSMRDKGGHVVLNADDLFKVWPEYANDPFARRWLGAVLYDVARAFTDALFTELLESPANLGNTIVFTAGGGASGKSTVLRAQAKRPEVDFVVDTTFSNTDRAIAQINAALAAGRNVEINYVYRDFRSSVRAMIERALDPKIGRIVPIDDLARTHFGAQETILTVLQQYEDDPRVAIKLWESVPGNTVKQLPVRRLAQLQLPLIDELSKQGQSVLDEHSKEANRDSIGQRQDLSSERAFYEAARSKSQKSLHNSG